jgi:hypothetical protein
VRVYEDVKTFLTVLRKFVYYYDDVRAHAHHQARAKRPPWNTRQVNQRIISFLPPLHLINFNANNHLSQESFLFLNFNIRYLFYAIYKVN